MGAIIEFFSNNGSTRYAFRSERDTRWNCSGKGGERAATARVTELERKYGKKPSDLKLEVTGG